MEKKRILWVDVLNITACMGVLLLHCTNQEVHSFSGAVSFDWITGLLTHSFFLWPVNVFFMLSGYTLLRKLLINNSINGGGNFVIAFYKQRAKRLLLPLLAWNVIYMFINFGANYISGRPMDDLVTIASKFITFGYNGFMWFFTPLIIIYLSLPFLAVFVLNADRKTLRLFLVISVALGCLSPLVPQVGAIRQTLFDAYIFGTRYIVFVVAGYYFGTFDITKATRKNLYVAALVCVMVMFCGTYWLQLNCPGQYKYFISYTNIPCAVLSFAVFVLFQHIDWHSLIQRIDLTPQRVATFSGLSLGIYLIQAFWFTVTGRYGIATGNILLYFVVMYALCIASVWMMKRLPLAKYLVP